MYSLTEFLVNLFVVRPLLIYLCSKHEFGMVVNGFKMFFRNFVHQEDQNTPDVSFSLMAFKLLRLT